MTNPRKILATACLFALAGLAGCNGAQDAATADAADPTAPTAEGAQPAPDAGIAANDAADDADADESGFTPLFDGQTLAGWHMYRKPGEPIVGWAVEDGTIVR